MTKKQEVKLHIAKHALMSQFTTAQLIAFQKSALGKSEGFREAVAQVIQERSLGEDRSIQGGDLKASVA